MSKNRGGVVASKKAKMARLEAENWNLKHPVGTPVTLLRDTGVKQKTRTSSEAFVCSAGYPVCFFENVTGWYLLERAEAV